MLKLREEHSKVLRHHGEKLSQKLTDLTHESKFQRVIVHDKHKEQLIKLPLLLGIVITLILPIFVGITVWLLLLTNHDFSIRKEK